MTKYRYIIFVVLGSILLLVTALNAYVSIQQNYEIKKMQLENDFNTVLIENMIFSRQFELQSEGSILSENIVLESDLRKDISIKEIFQDKRSLLIFRFSENHCDACISQQFDALKNRSKDQNQKVEPVLLANYSSIRQIKVLMNTYNLHFPIYNLKQELEIPIEALNIPYFFILNEDLVCRSFFSVIKESEELTNSNIEALLSSTYYTN